MKKILSVAALLAMFVTIAAAQAPRKELPYQSGEEVEFAVSFRAKMWPNTDMAKVTVQVEDDRLKEADTYRISAFVRTTVFRWVFKMDNYYTTWIDKSTGLPVKASCEISEGNYRYNNDYRYDWEDENVYIRWNKPGRSDDDVTDTIAITRNSRDLISLVYAFRDMDIESMPVDREYPLELVNQSRMQNLSYRYLGRETVKVKGFGDMNALHLVCKITTRDGESFEDGNDLHVWLSDDRNRIPLMLETPVRWGSARARLTAYKNLKFPDDGVLQ